MTYDEAIKRLEQIVQDMEEADAISMVTYKAKAEEAKQLLDFCHQQLSQIEGDITKVLQK